MIDTRPVQNERPAGSPTLRYLMGTLEEFNTNPTHQVIIHVVRAVKLTMLRPLRIHQPSQSRVRFEVHTKSDPVTIPAARHVDRNYCETRMWAVSQRLAHTEDRSHLCVCIFKTSHCKTEDEIKWHYFLPVTIHVNSYLMSAHSCCNLYLNYTCHWYTFHVDANIVHVQVF